MLPKIKRREFNGHFFNFFESSRMVFGFTENAFPLSDLSEYFRKVPVIQLKQIHSDIILFSDQIISGDSGDGIILNKRKHLALIRTADCVPLTFWEESIQTGGIIHIGWKGLYLGIESQLLQMLCKIGIDKKKLGFYIGPSIEQKCYPVGPEIYELFSNHSFRDRVFFKQGHGELYLDLKKALTLSLIDSGISPEKIVDSKICNFCESQRFPSFRRDPGVKRRIYNFLLFK